MMCANSDGKYVGGSVFRPMSNITFFAQWQKCEPVKPVKVSAYIEDVENAGFYELHFVVKDRNEANYQIQYSVDPQFKHSVKTWYGNKRQGETLNEFSYVYKTHYYVRVRSYVYDSAQEYVFSPWSSTISVSLHENLGPQE
jgi:hypothetical protein